MTRDELTTLLKRPSTAATHTGRFVCFQMIPVEERVGVWRFAGTAENLAEAFECCGSLFNRLWPRPDPVSGREVLLSMVDVLEVGVKPWWRGGAPREFALPASAKLVLLATGGAPYDDVGTALFEVQRWGALRARPIDDRPIND